MTDLQFRTSSVERIPPDEEKAGDIFSRLGYKIPDAIADLVDNSVDAGAPNVHVRFVRAPEGIHSVVIADDGKGMNEAELREAMRFGSRSAKSGKQLGKYGIGLKSASLSQAETVIVLSKQGKAVVGRRWTLENVKKDWQCELLSTSDVRRAFETTYGDVNFKRSGTIVIWERLEHLKALPHNLTKVLELTIKALITELGIRFHRFLETGRLTIGIDQQFGMDAPTEIPIYVSALNPFSYPASGSPEYPITFKLKVGATKLVVVCHIWPPKTRNPGYTLGGGKVALRQGFYFYRNDRVIQAGGWNGIRADDSEPHLSLARVMIDLPAALDSLFKLDVTKSRLDPSPQFTDALHEAAAKGKSFDQFIADAQNVYRKQKTRERARFPVVPGGGVSSKAQKAIAAILKEPGTGRPRKIRFKWTKLDPDEIVRVDNETGIIYLNATYKRQLSQGSSNDAPVLKVALMFLLQNELCKSFETRKSIEWLQRINQALIASLKE